MIIQRRCSTNETNIVISRCAFNRVLGCRQGTFDVKARLHIFRPDENDQRTSEATMSEMISTVTHNT